jgi:hypothetical protein
LFGFAFFIADFLAPFFALDRGTYQPIIPKRDLARKRADHRLVQRSGRKYSFGAQSDDVTMVT